MHNKVFTLADILSLLGLYMTNDEQIEKIRQAIMRYRELLDILQQRLAQGEKDYAALFDLLTTKQKTGLEEKQRQRIAAIHAIDGELTHLQRAILRLRFDMRDIEKAFEELYDHIATG